VHKTSSIKSGLAAGVHDSGQTHRTSHIVKEGRKELRYVLVKAAWHAVETSDFWKAEFERLCRGMEKNRATLAPALRLVQCKCRRHRAPTARRPAQELAEL
jgi:transposase